MPNEQDQFPDKQAPAGSRAGWSAVVDTWRRANATTGNLLGILCKTIFVLYFLFGLLIIGVRYVVIPKITDYRPDIEKVASKAIGRPVTIRELSGDWQGWHPSLTLQDVSIAGPDGKPALQLPRVSAVVSWWSLAVFDVRLERLDIDRPDMDIVRDATGRFHVAGMLIDPAAESDGRAGDWVMSQNDIHINEGRLRWKDDLRQAPELLLEQVNVILQNKGTRHHFGFRATPPSAIAAPLDIRARFEHPRIEGRKSDPRLWKGEVYADLRDTDLAAWKTYIDFPFDLQSANGSLRAWLSFDHARAANLTADLALSNVNVQLRKDLAPLDLAQANGRISVQETIDTNVRDGTPTFGQQGHAISVTDLSLQSRDGLIMPKTTLSERYAPANGNQPERIEVQATMLDLQAMAAFAERLPLPPAQLRMIRDFSPRGELRNFSVQMTGTYPDIQSYRVKGDFVKLGLQAQPARAARAATTKVPAQAAVPAIPGFDNFSGHVEAGDQGGTLKLSSTEARLDSPAYLSEPSMTFDTLDIDGQWRFEKNDMLLVTMRKFAFAQGELKVALSGTHLVPIDKRVVNEPGVIDLSGTVDGLALNRVGAYLPLAMHHDVHEWLTYGLIGGTLHDGKLRLKGNLAEFPFLPTTPNGQPRGEFTFGGKIVDGALNYAPTLHAPDGKAPMWPLLEKVQGHIVFDKTRMEVHGKTGETHGAKVADVLAVVPDLAAEDSILLIDGKASGPLQAFLRYTINSPVGEWIGHFTDESKGTGNASLALKLELPLHDMNHAKVQGDLKFANNGVTLMHALPEIAQTNGSLSFNEKGVTLNNIKGNFLGGPVTINGGSQKDGVIVVKADGTLTAAGLRRAYPSPEMQKLINRVNGSTRFGTTVTVRGKLVDVAVESNLRGLGLDFPAPLNKNANDALQLRFSQNGLAAEGNMSRDRIRATLGTMFVADYQRERNAADLKAPWKVVRGGLAVNAPVPQPTDGLHASIDLPSLNVDEWIAATESIREAAAVSTARASQNTTGIDIDQYMEPDKIAVRTPSLTAFGKQFDDVTLGLTRGDAMWQANIESGQTKGHITWNEARSGRGLGKVTARLTSLVVPRSAGSDVRKLLDDVDQDVEMPALDIVADSFQLYDKKLGRLELLANYVRVPEGREWRIRNLSLDNADASLNATGRWTFKGGVNTTHLDYTLDIDDSGKLLSRFGFADVIKGGEGRMNGDLTWKGLPFSLDYASLSGNVNLNMNSGQFLKVEPGAAKLLGVLSMQSLPRRLTLDFRDVFSEGFAFDGINGSAHMTNGVARTDNLKMRGVSATVLIDGTADIGHETQDLRAVVIPEINAGAASVAYALAVNPVIGAGTFLAQLFLRAPLAKAFTYEYAITGAWSDPNVVKVERKIEPAPGTPTSRRHQDNQSTTES